MSDIWKAMWKQACVRRFFLFGQKLIVLHKVLFGCSSFCEVTKGQGWSRQNQKVAFFRWDFFGPFDFHVAVDNILFCAVGRSCLEAKPTYFLPRQHWQHINNYLSSSTSNFPFYIYEIHYQTKCNCLSKDSPYTMRESVWHTLFIHYFYT